MMIGIKMFPFLKKIYLPLFFMCVTHACMSVPPHVCSVPGDQMRAPDPLELGLDSSEPPGGCQEPDLGLCKINKPS